MTEKQPEKNNITHVFHLNLISGQNLGQMLSNRNKNFNEFFVFVEVEFKGFDNEMKMNQSWRSAMLPYNLFHPLWNQKHQGFTFETQYPEYSVIIIRVLEAQDGTILGRTAIPFNAIRHGYRVVQLMDFKHHKIPFSY